MINSKQVYLLSRKIMTHGSVSYDKVSAMDKRKPQHGIRYLIPKDAKMDGLE